MPSTVRKQPNSMQRPLLRKSTQTFQSSNETRTEKRPEFQGTDSWATDELNGKERGTCSMGQMVTVKGTRTEIIVTVKDGCAVVLTRPIGRKSEKRYNAVKNRTRKIVRSMVEKCARPKETDSPYCDLCKIHKHENKKLPGDCICTDCYAEYAQRWHGRDQNVRMFTGHPNSVNT